MEAIVKTNSPQSTIVAFGGKVYTKKSYSEVPIGHEAEAKRHPFLDIRDPFAGDPAAVDIPSALPVEVKPIVMIKAIEADLETEEAAPLSNKKRGKAKG